MTSPTDTFDLRTAKDLAAELIDRSACELNMDALDQLHERIFAAFGAGDGPDAIAAKLTELGIKGDLPEVVRDGGELYGEMDDDGQNALSVALREVCGADSAAISTYAGMIYWAGRGAEELGHESVELPATVVEFLKKYEDFRYPDLYSGPVPQEVIDFQQDTRVGIERHEHIVRGPVREVTDRRGHSQPMPDSLVAAIGAAGLTAEDYGDQVLFYRDGFLWGYVQGSDGRQWLGQYGFRPDLHVMERYQGATFFGTRDDAVAYVLANVNTPRLLTEQRPDGRWQRGPLTSPARQVYVNDRVLLAALAGGLTIDQAGYHTLTGFTVHRDGEQVARVALNDDRVWQTDLGDGWILLTEEKLDVALLATIEALTAS